MELSEISDLSPLVITGVSLAQFKHCVEVNMSLAELIQPVFTNLLKGCYQLPSVPGKKMFYLVPLSGGIDSFVTAYTLIYLFPNVPFTFVHADTRFEVAGTEDALNRFETITGRKIIKISAIMGLLESVEQHGNFIPSQLQRSCTQQQKVLPIKAFYKALRQVHGDDAVFIQFVGIRADEPSREGVEWKEDYIASAYPLQSLGLVKSDVNKIISAIQGIPLYYLDKSRSGCQVCIFSRRSEIISSWGTEPAIMSRVALTEDIPTQTLQVYNALPTPVTELVGASRNWLNYYRPADLGNVAGGCEVKRGKNKLKSNVVDLFGASSAKKLYVAVEFFYYANAYGLCEKPHVFFEKLITYSTSMAGAKKALKHFWLHRIHTKELYGMDEESLNQERQIYIYEVEIDNFENEIPPSPQDVFTWQNDRKPLFAIRKTVSIIERILLTEGERQNTKSNDPGIRTSAVDSMVILSKEKEYGRILSLTRYDKPTYDELVEDIDIQEAPSACIACSK